MKTKQGLFKLALALCVFLWSCRGLAPAGGTADEYLPGQITQEPHPAAAEADAHGQAAPVSARKVFSLRQQYYIGRATAAQIFHHYRLWNENPALTAYLNKICMAIVVNSPQPDLFNGWRVAVLDSAQPRSFSTPGGHIFLTSGLVFAASSEDALAAAIAHEIARIQLQHAITAAWEIIDFNAATWDSPSDMFSAMALAITNILLETGFSADLTEAADRFALQLLIWTGYCQAAFLEVMPQINNPGQTDTAARIGNVQAAIDNLVLADTRVYRQARFNLIVGNP